MSRRAMMPVVLVGLLLFWGAQPAAAVDLNSPVKALQKFLGKKAAGPAPPQPSGRAAGTPAAASTAGKALGANGEPAGTLAPADTSGADSGALDEILLMPEPYYYQSLGRRDPFVSLVGEEYLAEHDGEDLTPNQIFVRGILWGEKDRFALVETSTGRDCVLRVGDTLGPFTVTRVEPDAITVYTSEYGVGRTVRLTLQGKGNKHERGER